jgi:hypothetical protein
VVPRADVSEAQRPLPNRSISVFKYREEFSVVKGKEQAELRGAEWAHWDSAGRLVFARSSCLYAANLDAFPEIKET